MSLYMYVCVCICLYMYVSACIGTYTVLHITANDVPQSIVHDVSSIGSGPALLIQICVAISSRSPCSYTVIYRHIHTHMNI